MSLSALTCPHCVGSFLVDSTMAGQEALCPNCKGMVIIPRVEIAPPPVPPAEPTNQFACPVCFQAFGALASMAGQQVMCPHCGSTVVVPPDPAVGLSGASDFAVAPPEAARPPAPYVLSPPPPIEPPLPLPSGEPLVPVGPGHVTSPPTPIPAHRAKAQVKPVEPLRPDVGAKQLDARSPATTATSDARPNRPIVAPVSAPPAPTPAVEFVPPAVELSERPAPTATEPPIRKLSPEERARYRLVKNLIVLAICAAVLGVMFLVLRYVPILKELSQRVELIYDLGLLV